MFSTDLIREKCSHPSLAKTCALGTLTLILVQGILEYCNKYYEHYCELYMDSNHRVSRFWNFDWLTCRKQNYLERIDEERYRNPEDLTWRDKPKTEKTSWLHFIQSSIHLVKIASDIYYISHEKAPEDSEIQNNQEKDQKSDSIISLENYWFIAFLIAQFFQLVGVVWKSILSDRLISLETIFLMPMINLSKLIYFDYLR